MIITVDTNIIITALINSAGQEFSILKKEQEKIDFVSCKTLVKEFYRNMQKISALTTSPLSDLLFQFHSLSGKFFWVDKDDIDENSLQKADKLIEGLDSKDYLFLAISICFDSLLWTGDNKLRKGLRRRGFKNIVTTGELKVILKGIY